MTRTNKLVTIKQALLLRDLGYKDKTNAYVFKSDGKFMHHLIEYNILHDWNHVKVFANLPISLKFVSGKYLSIPTLDDVIDWLRIHYNIVICNKSTPFVHQHKIIFSFLVKKCNLTIGWNGREILGQSRWTSSIYLSKREAISIALKYLKKQKNDKKKANSRTNRKKEKSIR